jgi:hypothetical protein
MAENPAPTVLHANNGFIIHSPKLLSLINGN